ncbi:hypothetical protein GGX14DRAFT_401142 [Mycena pura]|uniref:Uncharacterized protein n=1 Tax=Mycena pura TaxID=153505 RepID=A0AAD6V1M0_9AGAR|nr:hypothetical protein GGX14DRAFT_401142 [Mycena pura]
MSSADEHVKRTAESQRVLQAAREKAGRKNIYDSAQTRHDLGHLARLFEAEFKKPAYEWQINVSEAIVLELEAVVIAGTGAEVTQYEMWGLAINGYSAAVPSADKSPKSWQISGESHFQSVFQNSGAQNTQILVLSKLSAFFWGQTELVEGYTDLRTRRVLVFSLCVLLFSYIKYCKLIEVCVIAVYTLISPKFK